MNVAIVGWAHSPFGKFDTETVESLIVKTVRQALEHAGIGAADIDEVLLGHFNAGFSVQDFTASLVHQTSPDFRFKPATRVENACATGSAAVHQGIKSIMAGQAKLVLVVGVEQMSRTPSEEVGRNLLRASYLQEESGVEGGLCGTVRTDRRRVFPETRRSVGCFGSNSREKSQKWREQPVSPNPQGSRLRFLSQRERQEPVCRWAPQANRLFASV